MKIMDEKKLILKREELDKLDEKIVKLILNRLSISREIIESKISSGMEINDLKREGEIFEKIDKLVPEDKESLINSVFKIIINKNKYPFISKANKIEDVIKLKPFIIAGPCTVESEEQINGIAEKLSTYGIKLLRGGAFKPRTSPNTFKGLEKEGIKLLRKAADKYNMFSVTEVLNSGQLNENYDDIDIIQIGSRNMTSFGFLKEVGQKTAEDGKPVLLKRGFSSTLKEFLYAAEYIANEGNNNIILCLRGIRTFEQIDSKMRNTPDLASILELKDMTDLPVIFDPSHSTGNAKYVKNISRAALETGADGLMIETHNEPEKSAVDAAQSIKPELLKELIENI